MKTRKQKTTRPRVLILMSAGWAIRNYLRSDVLARLAGHADIVIAVPYGDTELDKEFGAYVKGVEVLPPNKTESLMVPLRGLIDRAHQKRCKQVLGKHREEWLAWVFATPGWKRAMRRFQDVAATCLQPDPVFNGLVAIERRILRRLHRKSEFAAMIDRVRPSLVLSTFPFNEREVPVVLEAKRRGIPTCAAILSWDNLNTRGRIIGRYDRYLLWSDTMLEDLRRFYPDIDPAAAVVTGTPQFDFYRRPEDLWEWPAFCERLGLDPNRRLLTYCCVSHRMVPGEQKIVARIYDSLMSADLPSPVQLLVRTHPLGDPRVFDGIKQGRPHLVLSRPWENNQQRYGWFTPSQDEIALLTNTVHHSAVGFNIRSTMTLDFAVMDRPVINVAFGEGDLATHFIHDFYRYGYYQPILNAKAARTARSIEELLRATRDYLADPQLDSDGRARAVAELCGAIDGRAGIRISDALLDLLGAQSELGRLRGTPEIVAGASAVKVKAIRHASNS